MPIQKVIIPNPLILKDDGTLSFTVQYYSDTPQVPYFGLALHYNSQQLELIEIKDIFSQELRFPNPNSPTFPGGSRPDSGNKDNDASTDQVFLTAWSTSARTWPGQNKINLYTVSFKVKDNVNMNDPNFAPTINFTGNGSQGFTLEIPGAPNGNSPRPQIQRESQIQSNYIQEQTVNNYHIEPINNIPLLFDLSTMMTLIMSTLILFLCP